VVSPSVHGLLKLGEIIGRLIGLGIDWVTNIPEVSPLGVEGGRRGCKHFIIFCKVLGDMLIVEGSFCEFGGSAYLKVIFGVDVGYLATGIEVGSSL
jgi:hypothetical protein